MLIDDLFYFSPDERQYIVEQSEKLDIHPFQFLTHILRQYQLIEIGVYNITPNLNHPTNQRMMVAPEND